MRWPIVADRNTRLVMTTMRTTYSDDENAVSNLPGGFLGLE